MLRHVLKSLTILLAAFVAAQSPSPASAPASPAPSTLETLDAADLLDEADFGPLVTGHAARYRRFVDFLDRHGLDHVFRSAAATADPTQRIGGGAWSGAVTVRSRVRPRGLRGRLKRDRRRIKRLARSPGVRRIRTTLARLGGGR